MREKSKLKCVPQFLFRSYVSHTYVFPSNSNRPHTSLAHPNGVRRKTGSDWQTVKTALLTRMYGPAVRCKKISSNWRRRSCINVSGLRLERVVLRAIMDRSEEHTSELQS